MIFHQSFGSIVFATIFLLVIFCLDVALNNNCSEIFMKLMPRFNVFHSFSENDKPANRNKIYDETQHVPPQHDHSPPHIQGPLHNTRISAKFASRHGPFSVAATVPPGTALSIQCQSGYQLRGEPFIICTNKVWSAQIGKCERICRPIISTTSLKVTCKNPGGHQEVENCTSPISGTVAKFQCRPFYEFVSENERQFSLCIDQIWDFPVPQCRPMCGIKSVSAEPLIIGGSIAKTTDYPWQVALYAIPPRSPNNSQLICSGSLISENMIITAAHCVYDDQIGGPKPLKDLLVGVGKLYRAQDDPRDSEAQFSSIKHIKIADAFKGVSTNLIGDIAVLITEKPFVLSKFVQPICIDWALEHEDTFTTGKRNASIVGWGYTQEQGNLPDELYELHVPFASYDNCSADIPKNYEIFFTIDKMCAGYYNASKALCRGDTGGGLIIRNSNGRYYLIGVSSVGPRSKSGSTCNSQQYTLYTKTSSYTTNMIYQVYAQYRLQINNTILETNTAITDPLTVISESAELCGLKNKQAETLIIHGHNATKGDYPWQIAIYDITVEKKLVCGGSLIHQRIILTAAHCVTNLVTNKLLPKERYMLAAGKHFRKYNDPRDIDVQYSSVKEMFIPPQYDGDKQNYMADIAVLVSERTFTFSKYIQPVCIDWDGKYEHNLINSTTKGYVSGWGYTAETGEESDVLKDLRVPYVDRRKCKRELPEDFDIYLTFDKICSGYLNQNISVCRGDSGGGLVFKIPKVNRYYIAGIVSLAPRAPTAHGQCDSQQYSIYTRVSHYITNFILAKVRLYK